MSKQLQFSGVESSWTNLYSEQAIESAHCVVNDTWNRYKVDLANENYGVQMYRTILDLNSKNMK